MTTPAPQPTERPPTSLLFPRSRFRPPHLIAWCLVALLALGYLWFVRKHCSPYASNADASCYLNLAQFWREGRLSAPVPSLPGLHAPEWRDYYYLPIDFRLTHDPARMTSLGAPGYPLHLLLASYFVGLDWSVVLVNVIASGAAALFLLLLARRFGLPWLWALSGVVLLWACPVFVYIATQPMTDVLSMSWCLAALWSALRARDRCRWALATGFAIGIAVLIRPANLVLVLPVAVTLGLRWRAYLLLGLAGLPAAGFQVWYNLQLWGRALTTGYGDISSAFGPQFIAANARYFATGVFVHLGPCVALAALAFPFVKRRAALPFGLLASWFAAFIGFYFLCFYSSLEWSLRYFLPVFPAVILVALWVGHCATAHVATAWRRHVILLIALALSLTWQIHAGRVLHALIMKRGEIIYPQSAAWIRQHGPDAIVFANQVSGALWYYTDAVVVRVDYVDVANVQRLYAAAAQTHRPVYAVLFGAENAPVFPDRLPGTWIPRARFGIIEIFELVPAP
ncbi:hypothetical protein K0B96_15010 [Horticoccus luteus]|uniref:Glycosyltransferase RgtA/B/C/D-like domain-containing protein n=1 Tax=Horticoccus luteus TaxID=2862869 RepID=A0A8F9XFZ0_9BACT|nr:glycosyltransferase family 39 protein [Horticoccus luteus]QYM78592.1 hypothetical protein K0B96_15010 [Horticoccus luteus]